ncbi:MAG TPA: flagellar motor protein MotB [Myxococcota bacterium]|nr:flagellar motor protein MotB [Myxococcota bacterium]
MERSHRRSDEESHSAGRDRWLLSYADYVTLLLALFIVLYASARLDAERSQSLFAGLQAAFFFEADSPSPVPVEPGATPRPPAATKPPPPIPAFADLEAGLEQAIESERLRLDEDPGVSLHRTERGLVVSLASAEFFPAGGVGIPEDRKRVLAALAPLFAADARPLRFEGHTDDRPIESADYPSNWELSSARAAAVARYFIDEQRLEPRRVSIAGFAEWRPIAPNDDAPDRALNRRVEIVLLEDGGLSEAGRGAAPPPDLGRLLDGLPPLPDGADESLRAPDPGPPPPDIPLP